MIRMAQKRRGMTAATGWVLCAALCFSGLAQARIDIDPRPLTLDLVWTGNTITVEQDFCVQSTAGANPQNNTIIDYEVTITVPLALTDGANQIPGNFSWVDLRTGVSTPLTAGAGTGVVMTGESQNCPGGNNGRLVVQFPNTAITAVPPGFYTQTFDVTVSNNGGGRSRFTDNVTMNLNLPDSIRVSQVDDILLGTFNGFDITATESLCVFRASGGNYGVTVTGSGAGGAFELNNGTSVIPFSVSWNDGTGASPLTAGALLSTQVNSVTGTDTCNNGAINNATLGINLLAADVDLFASTPGAHSGTLTILVEMQ